MIHSNALPLRWRMALLLAMVAGCDTINLLMTSFPAPGLALAQRVINPIVEVTGPILPFWGASLGVLLLTVPALWRGFRALIDEAGAFPALTAAALLFVFPGSYTDLQGLNDLIGDPSPGLLLALARNLAAGAFLSTLLVPWPAPDPASTMPNNARAMLAELLVDLPLRRMIPLFLAITLAFQFLSLGLSPRFDEEILQDWNARLFASGRLLPAPFPCPETLKVFSTSLSGGTLLNQHPPGWSVILSLGHLLRMPWLINPLLGALSLFLLARLARREYGRVVQALVGIFAVTSPFLWIQASSRMNHLFTLVLFLAGMLFLSRDRQLPIRHAFFAGALGVWAFATRPLEGLMIVGVLGLRLLLLCKYRLSGFRHILSFFAGAGLIFAGVSWYQVQITGSPWLVPSAVFSGSAVLYNTWDNVCGLGVHLFGSFIPGLLLMLLSAIALRQSIGYRDPLQSLYLLLALGAMALSPFSSSQDFSFGPRSLFLFLPAGFLLAARGLARLADLDAAGGTLRAPRILLIHLVFTLLVTMPTIGTIFLHARYGRAEPVSLAEHPACPPAPAIIFLKSDLPWVGQVMAKFAALGVSSPVLARCGLQSTDWYRLDRELDAWATASAPADPDAWARELSARFPGPQIASEPCSIDDFVVGEVFRANPIDLASAGRRFALDLGPIWNQRLRRALPGHQAWEAHRDTAGVWFSLLP